MAGAPSTMFTTLPHTLPNLTSPGINLTTFVPPDVQVANRTIATLTVIGAALTLQVYNPGSMSTFPTTSTLIIGPTEVALVDTQFQANDAEQLVKLVKATGKKLSLVYISSGDPDFYFGNEVIRNAFPECKFYATIDTIRYIESSKEEKVKFWGPGLKENAPKSIVVPQLLPNNSFAVDGHLVEVKGEYCWVPSLKAVLGGNCVFGTNVHLWMADTQTPESRRKWYDALTNIENLHPGIVVPGYFYPGSPFTSQPVHFSQDYLSQVEKVLPLTQNASQFIAAMKTHYPHLELVRHLEFAGKVLKGEMEW